MIAKGYVRALVVEPCGRPMVMVLMLERGAVDTEASPFDP